jgi:hypothetical protein
MSRFATTRCTAYFPYPDFVLKPSPHKYKREASNYDDQRKTTLRPMIFLAVPYKKGPAANEYN